ncbi:MAG: 1-aminocyclopropane-1-carboxylate deaminase [Devosia sp. 67-54]|uniref:pyridoxal phosphate-dependent aminotransferase n=1 Tax=unclassified Devosia TaxID=196773 RepID=UPI00095B1764|nr:MULTISPECIES: aminotransferase class I/II-fold pyridoxal phosphate-dependent enzyme [unclassified Devosia]MBN9304428.1 aminotransferase class I/II-fold pyridoxal phosphate-dependent enzyme [Devosia sp.]OJX18227.1 MAG: 1-aminocyclopropane-1-carboxylate deaminase [Devosia sp. 67-54]
MTSPTAAGMEPFHGLEINALARALEAEGRDIAFLEQGQPAAPPAPRVIEAVRGVLDGPQRYTHFAGMPALRAALARYYREQHGVAVSEDSIIATMSSSSGFILAFLGGFAPGAKIAVTRPGYTAYLNTLYGMGYRPVEIPVSAAEGWHLTPAAIAAAHAREPFAGLLLASPANPTGAAVDRTQLGEIVAVCARLGVRFISDEIYHGLDYRGPSVSALEFTRDAIVINSFSKYYCMTGWRIGWMVLPDDILRRTQILQQNLFIAAPTLSQVAATAALGERDYAEAQKAHYAANRPLLTEGLRALGFGVDEGDGAFYAYADASRFTNDSLAFCKRMLAEAGVAASPGVDFDRVNGGRYVRFSYAGSRETMDKALERLRRFLKA